MTLAALAAAREMARTMATEGQAHLLAMAGARVTVGPPEGACPLCGGPMLVQKTTSRKGRTLELGCFTAVGTVTVCAKRCRHPSGQLVTRRAKGLTGRLPPGDVAGYDVMVYVGFALPAQPPAGGDL